MHMAELAKDFRFISVTSAIGATNLGKLVRDAFAAKALQMPTAGIVAIVLTPTANVVLTDSITNDAITVTTAGKRMDVSNPLDRLSLTNAATVIVELYYGR